MKIPAKNQSDYYENLNEVLGLFPADFKEKYGKNATAHAVVERLARGDSPYNVLANLIQNMEDAQNTVRRIIENSPAPFHNVFQPQL